MSSLAQILAEEPAEHEEEAPTEPSLEDTELEGLENVEDDFIAVGEEAAVAEILDAFHSKDAKALRVALKSFYQLCRDSD